MADKDYYSFDEVLSDLRMEEEELKRLVSAGEIRAFRDQDTMRFKAADVERLKPGEAVAEEGLDDDLELDLEDELELGDDLDLGGPEPDLADELVLEDDGGPEELDLAATGARSSSRGGAPQRSTPRSQAGAAAEATDSPGMLFMLAVSFILLIFANFAALGAVAGQANALTGFLADMFSS